MTTVTWYDADDPANRKETSFETEHEAMIFMDGVKARDDTVFMHIGSENNQGPPPETRR